MKRLNRRIFGLFLVACVLAWYALTLSSCTVDLSHKHYYNDVGTCGTCGYSISQRLEYDEQSKTYSASGIAVNGSSTSTDGYFYFNFEPHGEDMVGFYILGATSVSIDRIDVYINAASHKGSATMVEGLRVFRMVGYSGTHYLRVRFTGAGVVDFYVNRVEYSPNPNV